MFWSIHNMKYRWWTPQSPMHVQDLYDPQVPYKVNIPRRMVLWRPLPGRLFHLNMGSRPPCACLPRIDYLSYFHTLDCSLADNHRSRGFTAMRTDAAVHGSASQRDVTAYLKSRQLLRYAADLHIGLLGWLAAGCLTAEQRQILL